MSAVERVYVELRRGSGEVYHFASAVPIQREEMVLGSGGAGDARYVTRVSLEPVGKTLCGKEWGRQDIAARFPSPPLRPCHRCNYLDCRP